MLKRFADIDALNARDVRLALQMVINNYRSVKPAARPELMNRLQALLYRVLCLDVTQRHFACSYIEANATSDPAIVATVFDWVRRSDHQVIWTNPSFPGDVLTTKPDGSWKLTSGDYTRNAEGTTAAELVTHMERWY